MTVEEMRAIAETTEVIPAALVRNLIDPQIIAIGQGIYYICEQAHPAAWWRSTGALKKVVQK